MTLRAAYVPEQGIALFLEVDGTLLEIAALPSWNNFTGRTAILLSQLGRPAWNDTHFNADPN